MPSRPICLYNCYMQTANQFPLFDMCLPEIELCIHNLVKGFDAGEISSWSELDERVKTFFTPKRMDQTCFVVQNWKKMASYTDGVTLTHVMCVFLGMYMMPEFLQMTSEQQQMMKWVVLFHDVEKEPLPHKRDALHPLKSAVRAANDLPGIGFPVTDAHHQLIQAWSEQTAQAFSIVNDDFKPDNSKLPVILSGIDRLFGENTPANLIIRTVLLHNSINVDPDYPTPNPLTQDEIKRYLTSDLFPLLKVMMLSDNEGWSLFHPEIRARQRKDTLEVFDKLKQFLSR